MDNLTVMQVILSRPWGGVSHFCRARLVSTVPSRPPEGILAASVTAVRQEADSCAGWTIFSYSYFGVFTTPLTLVILQPIKIIPFG